MKTHYLTKKTPVTMLATAILLGLQLAPPVAMAQSAAAAVAAAPPTTSTPDGAPEDLAQAPDAQEAGSSLDTQSLDTIKVTGFRGSLERSLDIKRGEAGVVDAIVAEDVGKFPDLNLAEALQRVPGVAIDRDAGEGRTITVRGLGAQFTRVRLNGMEAMATGGGTDSSGGVNRGRGFDFNTFASELFSQMLVRKTTSADIEEGSLGATVDLRTARPLDYDGFTFATGGQLGYNDLAGNTGPRATALISNTWADDTFGALFSLAYTERELVEEGHSTVRWDTGTSNGGFSADSPYTPALAGDVFHPRIPRYGIMQHDQSRLGMTASLQFNPSDNARFALDILDARFDADRTEDYFEAVSFSRSGTGKPEMIVRDGVVENGNLVYGVFDNADIRSESRTDEQETDFSQWTLSGDFALSDTFRIDALVGQAKSTYDNPVQTTVIMDKFNAEGYSYDYRGNDRLPVIDYGSVDPLDRNGWTLAEIRLRPQWVQNAFDNAQVDFSWSIDPAFRLSAGLNYKDYTYESREWRRASEGAVPEIDSATLSELLRSVGLEGINTPNGEWVVPDVGAIDDLFDIYSNNGIFAVSNTQSNVAANNRTVEEKDSGIYVQGDFSFDAGSVPVTGNLGVRHVKTRLTSDGYSFVGSMAVPTSIDYEYSDTLPALNTVFELQPDLLLRFGTAKVMSRPNLGFLNPGATVTVSGGSRTVNSSTTGTANMRIPACGVRISWG